MFAEVCQGAAQRGFTEQNELGKTFAFDRAYPPLRVTIQIWAACRVRRQLLFWVDDNYFSLSTTTTF